MITLFLFSSGSPGSAESSYANDFTVVVVQFHIDAEVYLTEGDFIRTLDRIFTRIDRQVKPDLVIFPEYTSVFFALMPWMPDLAEVDEFTEGWELVRALSPGPADITGFFLRESNAVSARMNRIWGALARTYDTAILAGSVFTGDTERSGEVVLRNRGVVYGSNGERLYEQDKVFLTPFEEEVLGITPSEVEAASSFLVKGRRIAFSICRDSFFSDWEEVFADAELWIDIKANGTDFDRQEAAAFETALPRRISSAGIPYGATVCLTGEFFDLFWEGESAILELRAGAPVPRRKAKTADSEEILVFTMKRPEPSRSSPGAEDEAAPMEPGSGERETDG